MKGVYRLYLEYYWLRIREIFDRKMSRKLIWGIYWETTVRISDLKLSKIDSKNKTKEIQMGLNLCRKIREHLINIEGGQK